MKTLECYIGFCSHNECGALLLLRPAPSGCSYPETAFKVYVEYVLASRLLCLLSVEPAQSLSSRTSNTRTAVNNWSPLSSQASSCYYSRLAFSHPCRTPHPPPALIIIDLQLLFLLRSWYTKDYSPLSTPLSLSLMHHVIPPPLTQAFTNRPATCIDVCMVPRCLRIRLAVP